MIPLTKSLIETQGAEADEAPMPVRGVRARYLDTSLRTGQSVGLWNDFQLCKAEVLRSLP